MIKLYNFSKGKEERYYSEENVINFLRKIEDKLNEDVEVPILHDDIIVNEYVIMDDVRREIIDMIANFEG